MRDVVDPRQFRRQLLQLDAQPRQAGLLLLGKRDIARVAVRFRIRKYRNQVSRRGQGRCLFRHPPFLRRRQRPALERQGHQLHLVIEQEEILGIPRHLRIDVAAPARVEGGDATMVVVNNPILSLQGHIGRPQKLIAAVADVVGAQLQRPVERVIEFRY